MKFYCKTKEEIQKIILDWSLTLRKRNKLNIEIEKDQSIKDTFVLNILEIKK